jgi:hypothetical protein
MKQILPSPFLCAALALLAAAPPAEAAGPKARGSTAAPKEDDAAAQRRSSAARRSAKREPPVVPVSESSPFLWALLPEDARDVIRRAEAFSAEFTGPSSAPPALAPPLDVEVVTPYSGPGSNVRVRVRTPPLDGQHPGPEGWRLSGAALGPSTLWNGYPGVAFTSCALVPPAGVTPVEGLALGLRSHHESLFERLYLTYEAARPIDESGHPTVRVMIALSDVEGFLLPSIQRFDCALQRDDGGWSVVELLVPMPPADARPGRAPPQSPPETAARPR